MQDDLSASIKVSEPISDYLHERHEKSRIWKGCGASLSCAFVRFVDKTSQVFFEPPSGCSEKRPSGSGRNTKGCAFCTSASAMKAGQDACGTPMSTR